MRSAIKRLLHMPILAWVTFPCKGGTWQEHIWARGNGAMRERERKTNITMNM